MYNYNGSIEEWRRVKVIKIFNDIKNATPKENFFGEVMSHIDILSDGETISQETHLCYKAFMYEDLDVILKDMSFKDVRLDLTQKIVEYYCGEEEALKQRKEFTKTYNGSIEKLRHAKVKKIFEDIKNITPKENFFGEVMSHLDNIFLDGDTTRQESRSYYKAFMHRDLDVTLKKMPLEEAKLALTQKIVEEHYRKKEALKQKKEFIKAKRTGK
ncbi:MAG: hypothetical protein LE168_04840 [Endomicrobium sp.]|nr:hypothetical protein [Endomicrobium sp.]